ncbi:MAG TPA: pilin [Candidatus Peribacterales bacterium]|nr:pilin [Candidatus Peribacterales bacterium]
MFSSHHHRQKKQMILLQSIIVLCLLFLPLLALAQTLPPPACTFPGCNPTPIDVINLAAIPMFAQILLNGVVALAVIFGIIGGARYLLSFGRDEELEKGKTTILWALGGVLIALVSQRVVIAVLSENYISSGTDPLLEFSASVVYIMTALLNVGFFLTVFWGGMRMVMAAGNKDEVSKGKKTIIYAIVGAVLINVIPFVMQAILRINA